MAGRRSLTQEEERRLLRAVRAMGPRDRALVTAQWMTGFRISEVLSWTVGTVMRNGALVSKIGLPPRKMKGGYGKIREKAANDEQVIQLRRANPFEKFQIGLRQLIADLMVQRMGENDKIVTRYMDDRDFNAAAFEILSRTIYDAIPAASRESSMDGPASERPDC